jgi:PilS N terminal
MSEILGAMAKYGLQTLGVIAVFVIAALATGTSKSSTEAANIGTLVTNITNLYDSGSSTADLTNAVVIGGKLEPSSMDVGGNLINQWGGPITVTGDPNFAAGIDITDAGIPQDGCASLATSLNNATTVSINGGGVLSAPIDATTVTQECTTGNNNIALVFAN